MPNIFICVSVFQNDIALVKLSKAVPSSGKEVAGIRNVPLPKQGDSKFPVDNDICMMKGWGCLYEYGELCLIKV